jgi:BirA family biotin operon repressor/biotin-[acetyl-CoA-carboxylase] ligase
MPSPYTDLARPPLSASRLRHDLVRPGSVWRDVTVVAVTESTNAALADLARDAQAEGLVLVAEEQRAGRGRLDRRWESPARAGILLSALLRPVVPASQWPLLSLVAGLATLDAVSAAGVDAGLKWPNDVVADDRKLAGVLVERVEAAAIVGIGLNVSTRADELPVATATSLELLGGSTDREAVLKELLRALGRRYRAFQSAGPESLLAAYREACTTIGRRVAVALPDGRSVEGVATTVDADGRLVVREDDGADRAWSAGDVVHLKAEG